MGTGRTAFVRQEQAKRQSLGPEVAAVELRMRGNRRRSGNTKDPPDQSMSCPFAAFFRIRSDTSGILQREDGLRSTAPIPSEHPSGQGRLCGRSQAACRAETRRCPGASGNTSKMRSAADSMLPLPGGGIGVLDCRDVARLFADAAGEELSAENSRLIAEHLLHCRACCTFVIDYQTLIYLARRLPPPPVPLPVLKALRRAVRGSSIDFPGARGEG
jgi:hypothetical protein